MTAKDANSQLQVPGKVPGAPRKRAARSAHPGVVLLKPDSRNPSWRARCEDPDTGKRVKVRLDPMGPGRNAQTRRRWAIEKARAIARRSDELASGAPRATGSTMQDAVELYYQSNRLRPETVRTYQRGTRKFIQWCEQNRVKPDELALAHLVAFRGFLSAAKKQAMAKGEGQRGKREKASTPRTSTAVNVDIRSIKAVLRFLRSAGLLPRLSRDDIADGLKVLSTPKEAPVFLRSPEIAKLLSSAQVYDRNRLDPLRPVLLVALLSGMRFGEVADLTWEEVDLGASEIRLGSRTKTKHARAISFEHSPLLCETLSQLHHKGATGRVWPMSRDAIRSAARRLKGAPDWDWQALRRTCGTFLTNAPGIFGASSAYQSARRLGHSVAVAEKHYLGVVKVAKDAITIEAAMGIDI